MGRRALRRNDVGMNLSDHLLEGSQLGDHWQPQEAFPAELPLEVEIGSGKGLFLERASGATDQHNFLGIEIARKYARFAAARLARAKRTNARVVVGDAQLLLDRHVPAGSLEAVHVYFPDPWWKKRHRKRRVVCPSFLATVVRTLRPGGDFHLWTDVEEYYLASLELLEAVDQLVGPLAVAERTANHDMDYQTHFERRVRLSDQPVYRCRFERLADEVTQAR